MVAIRNLLRLNVSLEVWGLSFSGLGYGVSVFRDSGFGIRVPLGVARHFPPECVFATCDPETRDDYYERYILHIHV